MLCVFSWEEIKGHLTHTKEFKISEFISREDNLITNKQTPVLYLLLRLAVYIPTCYFVTASALGVLFRFEIL